MLDRAPITDRVRELVAALPYAQATDNILGYLWGKEAYGAMMYAGAVSDLSIADSLVDPRWRPLMLGVAREVLAQAPVAPAGIRRLRARRSRGLAGSAGSLQPEQRQVPQRHLPRPDGASSQDRGRRHHGGAVRAADNLRRPAHPVDRAG